MASDGTASRFGGPEWMEVAEQLLDQLRGRIHLIQSSQERQELVASTLDHIIGNGAQAASPDHAPPEEERQEFLRYFLSYDLIEDFLKDPMVEDIVINAMDPIFVHRTDQGMVKTEKRFTTSRALALFVKKLVIFGGRTEVDPINDIELADIRGRVNIVLSPFGPQITITRAKEQPLSILQLIEHGTLTYELGAQLWIYVEGFGTRAANLIIAGGPGCGKTTLLNALLCFVPSAERVVVIEDTLELNTQCLEDCSRLESSRSVSLADLVRNSLRMRPDRIIVGEVRGEEARDLMTVANIGKYCMGTLHASTARETIIRLQNQPMNVPEALVNLIDVFIVLKRLRVGEDVLRVVGDVVETAGLEKQMVLLSGVWTYNVERQQSVEVSPSSVFRDRLAEAAGLTPKQILEETKRRAEVLRAMHTKLQITSIAEMASFCQHYVMHPEEALRQLGLSAVRSGKRDTRP